MKPILSAVGILAILLILIAPSVAPSNTAAPSATAFADSGADFVQSLDASKAPACSVKPEDLNGAAAVAPHCCATGAAAACRDLCKQQGPACKGTIGCRAGECVCNCSCP